MARTHADDRVECPLCGGRGTTRGRAFGRAGAGSRYRCGLCAGEGSVSRAQIQGLQKLREHMQRLADLMQIGDAEGAAKAARIAFRIAGSLIR